MESSTPASIDKYEIVRVLGRGATSTVYLAYDAFTEREVALKLINSSTLSDPELGPTFRKLLANEASLAGRIVHPHIVGIYDASLSQDRNYIVMEYVQGETLEKYSQPESLLPVEKVVEIMFKSALALEFASRHGVIHRDIKPANIMLCADGDIKIADFGAAVLMKSEETQVVGVGSPAYMSPEQIRQDSLTQQTDIYSLGVVMYRLLTGRMPFEADSNYALSHKILNEEPVSIRSLRPGLPQRLEKIVATAMRKNLSERYADWRAFSIDLAEIAALDLPQESASETAKFNTMKKLPFFADFTDVELWEVVRISVWGRVPAGTYLFHEGDEGNFFFILAEGEVRASKGTRSLGTHGAGHCFGEMCYIRQSAIARTATIVAITPATLFKIKRDSLTSASESCQLKFNKAFLNILVDRLAQANTELAGMH
jgi:serine/threonine protein kinase